MYGLRCCLRLRNNQTIKRFTRSDYYLNKGIEKLGQQLDVSKIIRREQNSKIFQNVLFDQDE